jgi:hypothetical protein
MALNAAVAAFVNERLERDGGAPDEAVASLLHSVEAELGAVRERMQIAAGEIEMRLPETLREMPELVASADAIQRQIDSVVRHVSTVSGSLALPCTSAERHRAGRGTDRVGRLDAGARRRRQDEDRGLRQHALGAAQLEESRLDARDAVRDARLCWSGSRR